VTGVVTQHARQARLNPSSRFLCWKAALTQSCSTASTRNFLADYFVCSLISASLPPYLSNCTAIELESSS
jgi:hypothetical protein